MLKKTRIYLKKKSFNLVDKYLRKKPKIKFE